MQHRQGCLNSWRKFSHKKKKNEIVKRRKDRRWPTSEYPTENKHQISPLDDIRLFYGCFLSTARRTFVFFFFQFINRWIQGPAQTRSNSANGSNTNSNRQLCELNGSLRNDYTLRPFGSVHFVSNLHLFKIKITSSPDNCSD